MKKILITFLLLKISIHASVAQQTQIIFRGDDMGFSHAANDACIDAYKNGIIRTVEVIVPGPWFEEAVQLLNENPGLDVGVHLVLTSEWSNLKWRPLTYASSLVDENGYFYPIIWPNENYPEQALKEKDWDIAEIEAEFRAQITLAKKRIPQLSHLTGHMGCSHMDQQVAELTSRLALEYDLEINPQDHGFERLPGWTGKDFSEKEKEKRLMDVLQNLKPGKYLSVTHPAFLTSESESIHLMGYENVGWDRDGETKVLMNDKVKDLINKLGIKLIGYDEVVKE